jgi:hypothetical protein
MDAERSEVEDQLRRVIEPSERRHLIFSNVSALICPECAHPRFMWLSRPGFSPVTAKDAPAVEKRSN